IVKHTEFSINDLRKNPRLLLDFVDDDNTPLVLHWIGALLNGEEYSPPKSVSINPHNFLEQTTEKVTSRYQLILNEMSDLTISGIDKLFDERLKITKALHNQRVQVIPTLDDRVMIVSKMQTSDSKAIDRLRVTNENVRMVLARNALEKDPNNVLKLERFHLSQDHLYQLVLKQAKVNGGFIAKQMGKISIGSETQRFEVAKKCLKEDPGQTTRYIGNFRLSDEQKLALAEALQTYNQGVFITHLKYFAIQDREKLMEFAISILRSNPWGGFTQIECFSFTEDERFAVAKEFARTNGMHASGYIKDFQISNEEKRFAIAMIAIESSPDGVGDCIAYYELNETRRIILAKKHSLLNLKSFVALVQRYEISDKNIRLEIAKSSAVQNFERVACNLKNFQIENEDDVVDLIEHVLLYSVVKAESFDRLTDMSWPASMRESSKWAQINRLRILLEEGKSSDHDFVHIAKEYIDTKEIVIPDGYSLQDVYLQIAKIRNKDLTWKMRMLFIKSIGTIPHFLDLHAKITMGERERQGRLKHLLVPMIAMANILSSCENLSNEVNTRLQMIQYKLGGLSRVLRDYKKPYVLKIASVCEALSRTKILSPEKKISFFAKICEDANLDTLDQFLNRLVSLEALISGNSDALTQGTDEFNIENLDEVLLETLLSDQFPFFQKIDDFKRKYQETLGSMRLPNAWRSYGARIGQLNEEAVRKAYENFLVMVVEGTYKEKRYNTDENNNPHLHLIENTAKEVFEKWKGDEVRQPLPLNPELMLVDTDNWQDLFLSGTEVSGSCQTIDGDPSLTKALLGFPLDGKNRMIAIKGSDEKLIARSIFRILWDAEKKQPVLFLEMIYPEDCKDNYRDAIHNFAIQRASKLGLPLTTTKTPNDFPTNAYPNSLVSLGSWVPYESVDSAGGTKSHGKFTISSPLLLT
ncbi:MAG: hypothetical protein P0S94_05240, partial [Simkaniaceae bacterium]|nr:hypothetical protein [Simkaniaceae bacterium]